VKKKGAAAADRLRRRILAEWRGVYVPPDLSGYERRIGDLVARVVQPTASLSSLTDGHLQELPAPLRILLRTLGARNEGGQKLLSFLLFEPGFTNALIDLGYADGLAAMARGDLPGRAVEAPALGLG
jgi:hypothetical protein